MFTQLLDRSTCSWHRSGASCYVCGHCMVRHLLSLVLNFLSNRRGSNVDERTIRQQLSAVVKASAVPPQTAAQQMQYVPVFVPVYCLIRTVDGSPRPATEQDLQVLRIAVERNITIEHEIWQQEMLTLAEQLERNQIETCEADADRVQQRCERLDRVVDAQIQNRSSSPPCIDEGDERKVKRIHSADRVSSRSILSNDDITELKQMPNSSGNLPSNDDITEVKQRLNSCGSLPSNCGGGNVERIPSVVSDQSEYSSITQNHFVPDMIQTQEIAEFNISDLDGYSHSTIIIDTGQFDSSMSYSSTSELEYSAVRPIEEETNFTEKHQDESSARNGNHESEDEMPIVSRIEDANTVNRRGNNRRVVDQIQEIDKPQAELVVGVEPHTEAPRDQDLENTEVECESHVIEQKHKLSRFRESGTETVTETSEDDERKQTEKRSKGHINAQKLSHIKRNISGTDSELKSSEAHTRSEFHIMSDDENDQTSNEFTTANLPNHLQEPGFRRNGERFDIPGLLTKEYNAKENGRRNVEEYVASMCSKLDEPSGAANGNAIVNEHGKYAANSGAAQDRRHGVHSGAAASIDYSPEIHRTAYVLRQDERSLDSFALDKPDMKPATRLPNPIADSNSKIPNGSQIKSTIPEFPLEFLQDVGNSPIENQHFEDMRNISISSEQSLEFIQNIERATTEESTISQSIVDMNCHFPPPTLDIDTCESIPELPKFSSILPRQNSSGGESEISDRWSLDVHHNSSHDDSFQSDSCNHKGSLISDLNQMVTEGQLRDRGASRDRRSAEMEPILKPDQVTRPRTRSQRSNAFACEVEDKNDPASIGQERVYERSMDRSFHLHHSGSSDRSSLMAEPPHPARNGKVKAQRVAASTEQLAKGFVLKEDPTPQDKLDDNNIASLSDENENKSEVFVVYQNHEQIEAWVTRELRDGLLKHVPGLTYTFMHKALEEPGVHKTEFVVNKLRSSYKVIIVLSTKFLECKYCRYALQTLIPNHEEKVVPVTAEKCEPPTILQNITHLDHTAQRFWSLLKSALLEEPMLRELPDDRTPPRPFIDGQEPFLILWQRPINPVEPHFQHSVAIPSTPDRRNDHRVVFRIGFFSSKKDDQKMVFHDLTDRSKRAPSFEVRLKINKVYKFLSSNKKAQPQEMSKQDRTKCVRFWKDVYRQPKSEEEMKNEIGFWIRFKNPQDAHKIVAYLTFDLLMSIPDGNSGKYNEYLVHSLNLDFETKAKRPKMKPKPRARRQRGSEADQDDEDKTKPSTFEMLRDFVVTMTEAMQTARPDGDRFIPTDGILGRPRKPIFDAFSKTTFEERHDTGAIDPETGRPQTIPEHSDELVRAYNLGNQNVARRGRPIGAFDFTENQLDNILNETSENIDVHHEYTEHDDVYQGLDAHGVKDFDEEMRHYHGMMMKEAQTVYPKPGLFRKKKYYDMCHVLERLAENSKDDDEAFVFHQEAERYIKSFQGKNRTDERIIVLLKQSGVEHYRNNLSLASDYVRQALELLPKAQYTQQMEARIYYYISSIYREKKKFGKAKYWIKRSKESLKGVEPGEDTAKAYYNEGRLYMKILTASTRHEECRRLAVRSFDMCLQHAKHDFEKYGMRLDIKLIRRCYLNMARIYVDVPEMSVGRAREIVTLEDLQGAKGCLEAVKMPEYWQNPSIRNQAHLLLAESGFFYRKYEMLNRMVDIKHKNNAKKNLNSALIRAKQVIHLGKIEDMKEIRLAEEFVDLMEASSTYVKGAMQTDWNYLRNHHDTVTSSDKTTTASSDDPECKSETRAQELERKKQKYHMDVNILTSQMGGDKVDKGDESDVQG